MGRRRLELGRRSEEVAAEWLEGKGCEILKRNYRGYRGEVDIIACKSGKVYFVEVRSGRSGKEQILQSISHAKINKIVQTGMQFIQETLDRDWDIAVLIIAVNWYNRGRPQIQVIPVY